MADDIHELVARVTAKVAQEMRSHEAQVFGVGDLKTYLADLGHGRDSAWEISYKTTSAPGIEQFGVGAGASAWEISYKTTSAPEIGQAPAR